MAEAAVLSPETPILSAATGARCLSLRPLQAVGSLTQARIQAIQ